MKRQNFRKGLGLISALMFPITISYISPVVISEGAKHGQITIALILAILVFLIALIFGRVFCAFLCPVGALQELYVPVIDKKAKNGNANYIKYIIWVLWLTPIILGFLKATNISLADPLFMTQNGISILKPGILQGYLTLLTITFVLSFIFGKRAFCHYFCAIAFFPVLGTKIRNLLKLPGLRLKITPENCKACGQCNAVCPMSHDVTSYVKQGKINTVECISCGECVDICKQSAIQYKWNQ